MVKTRQLFREIILEESIKRGIGLSTPDLYQNALANVLSKDIHPAEQQKLEQRKEHKQEVRQEQRPEQNKSQQSKN